MHQIMHQLYIRVGLQYTYLFCLFSSNISLSLSASQIAKLDFLERHFQLLGDCLTDVSSQRRPSMSMVTVRQPQTVRQPPRQISPFAQSQARSSGIKDRVDSAVVSKDYLSHLSSQPHFVGESAVAQPFLPHGLTHSSLQQRHHEDDQASQPMLLRHLPKSQGKKKNIL